MEGITLSSVVALIGGVMVIMSFVGTIWGYLSSPAKTVGKRVDDLASRSDTHDLRLAALEQSQRTLPSSSDLHALELSMAELRGEMKSMITAMRGQSDIMQRLETVVGRHEQHLLEGKR